MASNLIAIIPRKNQSNRTQMCIRARENAASIASTLLTTESLVADKPQPPAPAAPAAPDMGGMF